MKIKLDENLPKALSLSKGTPSPEPDPDLTRGSTSGKPLGRSAGARLGRPGPG